MEIGQLMALSVLLLLIRLWRASGAFDRHAATFNVVLMFLGFLLAGYQLSGYFFDTL